MKEELLKDLSEEQIAKIKACKSQEEILKLAKEEGVELTSEQLEAVSGGGCGVTVYVCPHCHEELELYYYNSDPSNTYGRCPKCGRDYYVGKRD